MPEEGPHADERVQQAVAAFQNIYQEHLLSFRRWLATVLMYQLR